MHVHNLHSWRVSNRQAVAIQESLRDRIRIQPPAHPPRLVAGADVAYSRAGQKTYAAVVVVELPFMKVVEASQAICDVTFPYIPGLLTFREVPSLLVAFRRLRTQPDAVLFDGHGLAHPRRFGLACHAGLLLNVPSAGCAKSRLVGDHAEVGTKRGAVADLYWEGTKVGAVLRTRNGVKPVYVSPGHLIDIESAVTLVLSTTTRYRIPEPIRLAHQMTTAMRRRG
jgi:deoxyribonuclease V